MAITADKVGWGTYKSYEGPWTLGTARFSLPKDPDFTDKLVRTVTATEGGTYSAVNMYDTCILTTGVVQLCEKLLLTSRMLGECIKTDLSGVQASLGRLPVPASLQTDAKGRWCIAGPGGALADTPEKMRALYLGGASGKKGEWTDDQKAHAREVCAVIASMWDSPSLQAGQLRFVESRIMGFVMPQSRRILFYDSVEDGWEGALKAAFMSFSLNLPAVADKWLVQASQDPAWKSATAEDRFSIAMKSVTLGPQIAIWPGRYKAIHPVLEQLFQVSIPSLDELSGKVHAVSDEDLTTPAGVQKALIALGYDLGPKGADGVVGPKTVDAVTAFQRSKSLKADGVVGPKTKAALHQALADRSDSEGW